MVKNRFVIEIADTHSLKGAITRLRNTESVFDAYRITPGADESQQTTLSARGKIE
jgi:GTP pyrophosphokinase